MPPLLYLLQVIHYHLHNLDPKLMLKLKLLENIMMFFFNKYFKFFALFLTISLFQHCLAQTKMDLSPSLPPLASHSFCSSTALIATEYFDLNFFDALHEITQQQNIALHIDPACDASDLPLQWSYDTYLPEQAKLLRSRIQLTIKTPPPTPPTLLTAESRCWMMACDIHDAKNSMKKMLKIFKKYLRQNDPFQQNQQTR